MPKKKSDLPIMYVRKGATLKEIYAQARREFTAADLQKYTEIEPTVPMEEVLADMERVHTEELKKLVGRKKGKRR